MHAVLILCLSVSQLAIVHRAHSVANKNNINHNIYKYIYVNLSDF